MEGAFEKEGCEGDGTTEDEKGAYAGGIARLQLKINTQGKGAHALFQACREIEGAKQETREVTECLQLQIKTHGKKRNKLSC